MAKTKGEAAQQAVAFRLSADLLKRLDAKVARMEAATPGLSVTRTDAVRVLLLKSLDAEEAGLPVVVVERRAPAKRRTEP